MLSHIILCASILLALVLAFVIGGACRYSSEYDDDSDKIFRALKEDKGQITHSPKPDQVRLT